MPNPGFLREVDYLRISLTDRCNMRCLYCMPEDGIDHKAHEEILTFEEILRLINIFTTLGVKKIRLTGGEPLLRKGMTGLVKSIAKTKGIEEIMLTTNAVLLAKYAEDLKEAGLTRINISLDTLKEERFKKIARVGFLDNVLDGIDRAKEAGFEPLKLNMVVMKGINDDEIFDFIDFAFSKGLVPRFIEFMKVTPLWKKEDLIPLEDIIKLCSQRYVLEKTTFSGSGPAGYYRTAENKILGFIQTIEHNCQKCTRLRLTSTGELKICLYENGGLDLRGYLRGGVSDEDIRNILIEKIALKPEVDYRSWEVPTVYMSSIGG